MAELDGEDVDTIDLETTTEDDTIYSDITEEDYIKEKVRREKAEKTLVELKKQLKEKAPTTSITETDLEIRDFVKENPEYKEYQKEIRDALDKGYTLKQAKALVDNDDKTIENRKKTNSMNITNGELPSKNTYTKADLDNMSQSEYNRVMDLKEKGKVTIKR